MADSREKLAHYMELLRKWQKSVNRVSTSTINEARQRHFDDSCQLADLISQNRRVYDLGSGAGFPGMVLAMIRPDLDVTLIESDHKKCTFLSTVSRETSTPVRIVNRRIEDVSRESLQDVPDIIVARALASLDRLCGYCLPWAEANPDLVMLFLKGERVGQETGQAREIYDFEAESVPSRTSPGGVIVKIVNLSKEAKS